MDPQAVNQTCTTHLAARALAERKSQNRHHGRLFERILPRLSNYFYKQVWRSDDVDELVSQTLLLLQRSLREKSYDPTRSFNAWLWIKAHTVFLKYLRRLRSEKTAVPLFGLADPARPQEQIVDARHDARLLLEKLQAALGPEDYELFLLACDERLNLVEISQILGRARKTLRKRLQASLALARRLMET